MVHEETKDIWEKSVLNVGLPCSYQVLSFPLMYSWHTLVYEV